MDKRLEEIEAVRIVTGAYMLSLSSISNPVHPDNLESWRKFESEPLRYAVSLVDEVQRMQMLIKVKDEALMLCSEILPQRAALPLTVDTQAGKARIAVDKALSLGHEETK